MFVNLIKLTKKEKRNMKTYYIPIKNVHTLQESTPPSAFPAHSMRSVMLYSGSNSWHCVLLKRGTTASCNTLATSPGDQKQTAYTWPSKRLLKG